MDNEQSTRDYAAVLHGAAGNTIVQTEMKSENEALHNPAVILSPYDDVDEEVDDEVEEDESWRRADATASFCARPAIHLILSNLSLRDRIHTATVSRHWYAAARSHARLGFSNEGHCSLAATNASDLSSSLHRLIHSPLRGWVTSFAADACKPQHSLHHLACIMQLPRLRALSIGIPLQPLHERLLEAERTGRPSMLVLPPTLTSLDLSTSFCPDHDAARRCHAAIMAALKQLGRDGPLHTLRLTTNYPFHIALEWEELLELRSVRHLYLRVKQRLHHFIPIVKRMHLHTLSLEEEPATTFLLSHVAQLVAEPHNLGELRSLGSTFERTRLTAVYMQQLQRLPSLDFATLNPHTFSEDALAYLTERGVACPSLTLEVRTAAVFEGDPLDADRLTRLIQLLSSSPSLTGLHVRLPDDYAATRELAAMVSSAPTLRELFLSGCIPDLACLDCLNGTIEEVQIQTQPFHTHLHTELTNRHLTVPLRRLTVNGVELELRNGRYRERPEPAPRTNLRDVLFRFPL